MNKDGDYSAAYVLLTTDDPELGGFGLTFTIGRGNELCVAAARQQAALLVGMDVDVMAADMAAVYRVLTADSQLRWLGPEKGVVHLSLAAVLNAAWDLVARRAGVPLWRLLAGMSAQQLAAVADLRYVSDVLTRAEAESMLAALESTRAERIALLDREWLSLLHDLSGLARLQRREVGAAVQGGGRGGLLLHQAEGRRQSRGRSTSMRNRP